MLGIGIIRRCHLYDIRGDEIYALEAADDGAEFAGGPAAGFGRAGCGGDCDGGLVSGMKREKGDGI